LTTIINASPTNGLTQTADGSGVMKVQSNGVTTNALAWVRFSGASPTIASSYNVSSLTRQSAGNYTISFTTATADANYAVLGTGSGKSGTESPGIVTLNWGTVPSTSSFLLNVINTSSTGIDNAYTSVVVFGN